MKKHMLILNLVMLMVLSACTVELPPETSAPIETKPPVETTAPVETIPPQPTIPDGAYPAGEYTVGKDIPVGEYVFIPYEADLAATAHIKRNGESFYFCETVGQSFATVQQDELLIAKDCYFFSAEGYIAAPNSEGVYGPGMYRVGIDIPPGEYQITHNSTKGFGEWSFLTSSYMLKQTFVDASPIRIVKETPDIADLSISGMYALVLGADTYASPAPPPENATFLFPEAPEVTEVKALPDSYDAAALVSPYWEHGVAFGEANCFYIFLPEIYPFSEDAVAAQQEIYQIFYDHLHWLARHSVEHPVTKTLDTSEVTIFSGFGGTPINYCGYSAGIRDGILSLTVRIDDYISTGRKYYVYNFDLATGKRLDAQSVADRIVVMQDAVKQAVTDIYVEMYAPVPDKTVDFYQENLKKTLSEENLAAGQLCIGEDGSVMMVVEIYTIGNLEHVQRLVKIAD